MSIVSREILVDSENRLIISEISSLSEKSKRINVSGETTIDEHGRKISVRKIVLDGKWILTENHDLKFKLTGKNDVFSGSYVILRGEIVKATGNALSFRVRTAETINSLRSSSVEIKGVWASDKNNRITFKVSRSRGLNEILRFQGAWKLSKFNEIIYQYEKTILKTKVKKLHTLVFLGEWQLAKNKLVYRIEGNDDSFFSFTAKLQSKSLVSSSGKIKYQVGIRFSRGLTYHEVFQKVELFGKWKLSKDLNVGFIITYSGRKKREIKFTIDRLICEGTTLAVSLVDGEKRPIGLEVSFSKVFSRDKELFLAISKYASDISVLGGMRIKFYKKERNYEVLQKRAVFQYSQKTRLH